MLVYHYAFDLYHTIFRILTLLQKIDEPIEKDKVMILDFLLVFPNELKNVSLPRELMSLRTKLVNKINLYNDISNRKRIFSRITENQSLALRFLFSIDLIDTKLYEKDYIKMIPENLPEILLEKILMFNQREKELVDFLTGPLRKIDLYGNLGLKSRTKLMEYRYDAV